MAGFVRPKPYTPEEDALILAVRRRGEYRRVAAQIGRSYSSVANRARRLGLEVNEDIGGECNRVVAMRSAGKSLKMIAAALGVTRYRVATMLGRAERRDTPRVGRIADASTARLREIEERKVAATAWKRATGGLPLARDFDAIVRAHRDGTLDELARRPRSRPNRFHPSKIRSRVGNERGSGADGSG